MEKRFVYFYFMKNDPGKIQQVVPSHIKFWKESNLKNFIGGPFSDKSGGIISFVSKDIEEATNVIMNDPFIAEGILSDKWIKEWVVE